MNAGWDSAGGDVRWRVRAELWIIIITSERLQPQQHFLLPPFRLQNKSTVGSLLHLKATHFAGKLVTVGRCFRGK